MITRFEPVSNGDQPIRQWIAMDHDRSIIATIRENDLQPGLWYWFGMGMNTISEPMTLDQCKEQIHIRANRR